VIKIEFVGYAQAKNGQSACTISQLKSVKVDPQAISGIDYHSVESRKASFEFYCTDWVKTNFVDTFSYISDTKYNIYAIRYSIDDVTEYIGYVKPTDVKYDQRTKMVKISCTDILGVLLELADTDNDYTQGSTVVKTLLEEEITDILSGFDVEYTDTSDEVTYSLTDFEIVYNNYENFEWVVGTDGLAYDPEGGVYGGGTNTGRIRSVVYDGSKFIVKICDFYEDIDRDESEYHESIDYVYFEINTDLFISAYYYRHLKGVYDDQYHLWDNYLNSGYGSNTSSPSATNGDDVFEFGLNIHGARLYFTGDLTLDSINIDADEDVTYTTENRKKIITALLILMNAGMKIEKDGDIVVEDKDLIDEGSAINVDAYIIDNENGFILHSESNFDSYFDFVKDKKHISGAITQYYDNLFESFRFEYNMEVNNVVDLALGDTIAVNGKDMKIVEIDEPYNMNIYIIKAWGE